VLPALLVTLAAIADARGSHTAAFDVLLLAVPCAAWAALAAFGDRLDARDDAVVALQALLSGTVVFLLVLSCVVRSTAVHGIPPLAMTAVAACLVIFAVKATVAVAPFVRRLAQLRPAKP
jgi:Na+/phosphate symporter